MGVIFLRNRTSGGGGGPWSPVGKTGVVAAWDMETVYQEAALSTAAADTDPVGGVPDLTGNGNILSNTGSERPVRDSGGGLFWLDLDGTDDRLFITLPGVQRTTDMTLMLGVFLEGADYVAGALSGLAGPAYSGLCENSNNSPHSFNSGTSTVHINGGASVGSTRDAASDAIRGQTAVYEMRNVNLKTAQWDLVTSPELFAYSGARNWDGRFYRGALVSSAISSGDLTAARAWVAAGAGVTL